MSMINLFLQKRKMHESQHGILMVIIAYALSVLMLIMGSDMFYNINSEAAGMSKTTDEETQEKNIGNIPRLMAKDIPALLTMSQLPYGIAEVTQTGLGTFTAKEGSAAMARNSTLLQDASEGGHTMWLLGSAMNTEEYTTVLQQIASLDPVNYVVSTKNADAASLKNASKKDTASTDVSKSKEDEIFSLSTKETAGTSGINVTSEEISMLERIVQAEAGGEDMVGKILIANVIMNRIEDDDFPDTVEDVIFQNKDGDYQFSPVDDQRYYSVKISRGTKEAVERALDGEDYSKGALYFIARKRTDENSAAWFDNNLKWLFKHGGHEFYK